MIKKIIKYSLLILGTLLLLALALTYLYQDKIKDLLITELNNELSGVLEVEGFEITLLGSLPNARAEFKNIRLKDKNGKSFLNAEILGFDFSLFSLAGSNPKINTVIIKNGTLEIIRYKNGHFNTEILNKRSKTGKDIASTDFFKLSLKEAKILNTRIHYIDKIENIDTQVKVEKSLFSGEFSQSKFILYSDAQTHIINFVSKGKNLYRALPFKYKTIVYVDFETGEYKLSETNIGIGVLDLIAEGDIKRTAGGHDIDILLSSKKSNLSDIFSVLPSSLVDNITPFNSKGEVMINVDINGSWIGQIHPEVLVELKMSNGSVEWADVPQPIKNLSFLLKLHNLNKTYDINASNINFDFFDEHIVAQLTVKDIFDPQVKANLEGRLNLSVLNPSVMKEGLLIKDGYAFLKNTEIEFHNDELALNSNVLLTDVDLNYHNTPLLIDTAKLILKKEKLKIIKAHLSNEVYDGNISGEINHLDRLFIHDDKAKKIDLNLNLSGYSIDLDKVLNMVLWQDTKDTTKVKMPTIVAGEIKSSFKNLTYKKITTKDIDINLSLKKKGFDIEGDAEAFGGDISLEGDYTYGKKPKFYSTIDCKSIDAELLFKSFDNFDQEVIQSKNIKGKITSAFETNLIWDESGQLDKKKLEILGAITIDKGELIGLKILDDFGQYVHIEDLRHIRFDKLQNWFQIKKGKIFIPNMFIHSNAVNMTICGTHNFNNIVQYNVKLNAARILINRYFNNNPNKKFQPKKKDKFFNLYFTLEGPLDKIRTKANRKKVIGKFNLFEFRQNEIKNQLENALGPLEFMQETEINVPATDVEDDEEYDTYDEDAEADENDVIDGF